MEGSGRDSPSAGRFVLRKVRSQDGSARFWDLGVDSQWPPQATELRTEVETGTVYTQAEDLKVLPAAQWARKKWCEYEPIRHALGRSSAAEADAAQRLCRQAVRDAARP